MRGITQDLMVELVKAAGQEVINRASDLVGDDFESCTEFDIVLSFPYEALPKITVRREHAIMNCYDVLKEWS